MKKKNLDFNQFLVLGIANVVNTHTHTKTSSL